MIKVLLRAPLLTNSGYGIHSRQVFSWLHGRDDVELTVECVQWGRTSWILDDKQENGVIKNIINCSRPIEKGSYDISFQVQLPDEWDNTLAKRNIGITAVVETDKCNPKWTECCNAMDEVIVPSTFTKNVLKRSGMLTTKVTVIPEWFNSLLLNNSILSKSRSDERYNKITTSFNILAIGTLTSTNNEDDRKNLKNTIKWLCEEFRNHKDVGVVLKTNFGKGTSADKQMCQKHLQSILKEVRGGSQYPAFYFLHGNMKKEEIAGLVSHNKVKAYVSATRGEGYGLPLIEAAVSGVPIVATGWSGHLEFLQRENFGDVDYELVEINETKIDGRIFQKGFRWANPNEKSFKSKIRNVYENYDEAKQKAKTMKKHIQFNFNASIIKKQYDDLLKKVIE